MKLEKQVVSLELAKQLKEAGYPQESLFYWVAYGNKKGAEIWYKGEIVTQAVKDCILCSAPTVAELGEKFRNDFEMPHYDGKTDKSWYFWGDKREKMLLGTKSEANARAKMWLYLKKNKLLR